MSNDALPQEHILLAVKRHPEMKNYIGHRNTMIDALEAATKQKVRVPKQKKVYETFAEKMEKVRKAAKV